MMDSTVKLDGRILDLLKEFYATKEGDDSYMAYPPGKGGHGDGGYWVEHTKTIADEAKRDEIKQELISIGRPVVPFFVSAITQGPDELNELFGVNLKYHPPSGVNNLSTESYINPQDAYLFLQDIGNKDDITGFLPSFNEKMDELLQIPVGDQISDKYRGYRVYLPYVQLEGMLDLFVHFSVDEAADNLLQAFDSTKPYRLARNGGIGRPLGNKIRDTLVEMHDERILDRLWSEVLDHDGFSGPDAPNTVLPYLEALGKMKGELEFIRLINDNEIQPAHLREIAYSYICNGSCPFIDKRFVSKRQSLGYLTDPAFWNRDFNDLRVTLLLLEKDPRAIQEIFDHPSEQSKWKSHHMKGDTHLSAEIGTAAIPILSGIIASDGYANHLREYAAVELNSVNNGEKDFELLEMMNTPNCRYAAKALVRVGYRKPDYMKSPKITPEIVEAFFSHWQDIDSIDWKVTFASDDPTFTQIVPRLVNILTDKAQDAELKSRSFDVLTEFLGYNRGLHRFGRSGIACPDGLNDEERIRIFDYYLGEGYDESKMHDQLFVRGGFGSKNMQYIYGIARDINKGSDLRIRALTLIGKYGKHLSGHGWADDSLKYLRNASLWKVGKYFEPNNEVRAVAKATYSAVK